MHMHAYNLLRVVTWKSGVRTLKCRLLDWSLNHYTIMLHDIWSWIINVIVFAVVPVGSWHTNTAATLHLGRFLSEWTWVDVQVSFHHVHACRSDLPRDSVWSYPRNAARNHWTHRRLPNHCRTCHSYLYRIQITGGCDGSCGCSGRSQMRTRDNLITVIIEVMMKVGTCESFFLHSNRISNRIGRIYHASRNSRRQLFTLYSEYLIHSIGIYFVFVTNESYARNWVLVIHFSSVLKRVKLCRCTII